MVYLSFDKAAFSPAKLKEMNQKAIESDRGDDNQKNFLLIEDETIGEIDDFDDGVMHCHTDVEGLGYISISVRLTDEDIATLIDQLVKKLNKLKTVIQSIKGLA